MKIKGFLLVGIVSLFFSCKNDESEVLQQQIALLQDSLEVYRSVNDSLHLDSTVENIFFGRHEITKLRMHGLRNAPQQIIDDLRNKTELIPYKAELGGTMRFWNIGLLKTKWVLAEFTDGHVTGALLLGYDQNEDGGLQWKLLDQYLD